MGGGWVLSGGGSEGEGCRWQTDQDGDGVLILGANDGDVAGLDPRCFELGEGLIDVGLGGYASLEAVVGDAVGLLVVLDGIVEELLGGIGGTGAEVVHGELCLEAEQGGLEVGCAGGGLLAGCPDAAPDAAPEIDLVGEIDGELQIAAAIAVEVGVGGVEVRAVRGLAEAAVERGHTDGWRQTRAAELDERSCLAKAGLGRLDALIGGRNLGLERIELGIPEDGPPLAAQPGVGGLGELPAGLLLEGRSHGGGRLDVLRSDHAAGQQQEGYEGGERAKLHRAPPDRGVAT